MQQGSAIVEEDSALVSRRRKQIVDAAMALFSKQGYYRTTIKEVATLAGISPGLIYQYVSDKEDLLFLVLRELVSIFAREIRLAIAREIDPLGRLQAVIVTYCQTVNEYRSATLLTYRSTKSLSMDKQERIRQGETEINGIISSVLKDCVDAGLVRNTIPELLTNQIVMIAHSWALKAWSLKAVCTLEEYIDENTANIFGGALTRRGLSQWESAT
jgi:AcrR family transcriptional regulator